MNFVSKLSVLMRTHNLNLTNTAVGSYEPCPFTHIQTWIPTNTVNTQTCFRHLTHSVML